jgi:hypothetical protein
VFEISRRKLKKRDFNRRKERRLNEKKNLRAQKKRRSRSEKGRNSYERIVFRRASEGKRDDGIE